MTVLQEKLEELQDGGHCTGGRSLTPARTPGEEPPTLTPVLQASRCAFVMVDLMVSVHSVKSGSGPAVVKVATTQLSCKQVAE